MTDEQYEAMLVGLHFSTCQNCERGVLERLIEGLCWECAESASGAVSGTLMDRGGPDHSDYHSETDEALDQAELEEQTEWLTEFGGRSMGGI